MPRRGADSDITKTLLTPENASIPEEYVDYYDALLAQYAAPNGISVEGVGKILLEAGVDSTARERIWGVIMRGGKESVGRDEVNVLLAMIGLAQEGDEISIDGVDYRRRSEFANPSSPAHSPLDGANCRARSSNPKIYYDRSSTASSRARRRDPYNVSCIFNPQVRQYRPALCPRPITGPADLTKLHKASYSPPPAVNTH